MAGHFSGKFKQVVNFLGAYLIRIASNRFRSVPSYFSFAFLDIFLCQKNAFIQTRGVVEQSFYCVKIVLLFILHHFMNVKLLILL